MAELPERREKRHRIEVPPMITTSASQAAQGVIASLLTAAAGADLDLMKDYIKPGLVMNKGIATAFPETDLDLIPQVMENDVEFRYREIIDLVKKGIAQGVGGIHATLWESFIGTSYRLQMYTALMNQIAVAPFVSRYFNEQCRPTLPDDSSLIRMFLARIIDQKTFLLLMGWLGWSEDNALKMMESDRPFPAFEQANELFWRGVLTEDAYTFWLRRKGFDDATINVLKELRVLIPPAPDLIQMVVREAFDPAQVVKAPSIFAEYMAKKGYSLEWSDRYWTAHFLRAAIGRIEERYRRGELSESELLAWYTLADIHPGDHKHLVGTIYSAPTRLDMRQGYAAGIYTHDDLVRFCRWRNLSPGDAEMAARSIELYLLRDEITKMAVMAETDFVDEVIDEATLRSDLSALRLTAEEVEYRVQLAIHKKEVRLRRIKPGVSIDVLRDEITRMAAAAEQDLVDDLIDEYTFRADLKALGFTDAEIEYRESLAFHKRETELRRLAVDAAKTQYLYGKITEEEFRQQLLTLGVSMTRADLIIKELSVRRKQTTIDVKTEKKKRLTEAKVATARDLGLISDGEYTRRLIELDYTPEDADLLLSIELTPRPVTAEELLRRRRTIEARLNRARRRFELQIARLSLDIQAVEGERVDLEAIAAESIDVFNTQISILEREITEFSPGEVFMRLYGRLLGPYDITVIGYESITRRIYEEIFMKPELAALIPDPVRIRLNNWKILRERREFAVATYDKRLKALVTKKTHLGEILVMVEKQRDEELAEYEAELKLVGGIAS